MATLLDPNRAAFVRQAYRYTTEVANGVLSRNASARDLGDIDTGLDEAGASDLGQKYLAENAKPRAFEIVLQGRFDLTQFIGGPPSFILHSVVDKVDSHNLKVFSVSINREENTTTIQVRG